MKQSGVNPPPAKQDDRLAFDQALQIVPIHPGDLAHIRLARIAIFAAVPGALIPRRLRYKGKRPTMTVYRGPWKFA
jgi:hypothetical protein